MRFRYFLWSFLLIGLFWKAKLANSPGPVLVDVTAEAGLKGFKNVQGGASKQHIIETMGGGAAFLDYDHDGNLDILLVRGTTVEQFRKGG